MSSLFKSKSIIISGVVLIALFLKFFSGDKTQVKLVTDNFDENNQTEMLVPTKDQAVQFSRKEIEASDDSRVQESTHTVNLPSQLWLDFQQGSAIAKIHASLVGLDVATEPEQVLAYNDYIEKSRIESPASFDTQIAVLFKSNLSQAPGVNRERLFNLIKHGNLPEPEKLDLLKNELKTLPELDSGYAYNLFREYLKYDQSSGDQLEITTQMIEKEDNPQLRRQIASELIDEQPQYADQIQKVLSWRDQ